MYYFYVKKIKYALEMYLNKCTQLELQYFINFFPKFPKITLFLDRQRRSLKYYLR